MLHEYHCEQCGGLICKEDMDFGVVEIKCHRCNFMNVITKTSRFLESVFTSDPI